MRDGDFGSWSRITSRELCTDIHASVRPGHTVNVLGELSSLDARCAGHNFMREKAGFNHQCVRPSIRPGIRDAVPRSGVVTWPDGALGIRAMLQILTRLSMRVTELARRCEAVYDTIDLLLANRLN